MKWWHLLDWPWINVSADLQRRHAIGMMALSGAAIVIIILMFLLGIK
jgi:hypothetical protein